MLPSMPIISTLGKEVLNEEGCSSDQNEASVKALDLSLSAKKSSPLKHVTPILKKYNTQRKGKGGKKMGPQIDQLQTQTLRPIAPKHVMVVISPGHEEPQTESGEEVKEEKMEPSLDCKKGDDDKVEERKDSEDDLAALMQASTTIQSTKGRVSNVTRKKTKQLRDMESSIMLLTPDDPVVREEKSYGFAQAYFLKVKERLGGTELYQAFLHTMNEFGRSILEVRDLYYKVTALLSQHPDLSEEFLAFLLPEQAMQCGKLMEYLMITMMKDFFRRLEMYFEKQPQQMRKFYSALSSLCDQGDVSLTDVRSTILPLLKGNSVLIDNFLNLLPEEKPPESMMTEFEDMEVGDCNKLKNDDFFETLVIPKQEDAFGGENCACNCHQSSQDNKMSHCVSCGTKFIHGKVYLQNGRLLRPAKVEFPSETAYQTMKRLSVKSRPKVKSRKRTIRLGNSPLKRSQANTNSSHGNTSPKGSRAGKAKSAPKARSTKSCRKLLKSKSQNTSKQTPVSSNTKSSAKGSQSRVTTAEKITRNTSVNVVKSPPSITSSHSIDKILPSVRINPGISGSVDVPAHPSSDGTSMHSVKNTSDEIPHDESAIFPPVTETADSDMTDFSLLSSVLCKTQNDSKDGNCEEDNLSTAVPEDPIEDLNSHSPGLQTLPDKVPKGENTALKAVECGELLPEAVHSEDLQEGPVSQIMEVEKDILQSPQNIIKSEELDIKTEDVCVDNEDAEMKESDSETDCVVNKAVNSAWTRDEDKVILQMCKMEHSFQEISEHLPQRSVSEIQSRFEILINIMKQLTEEKMEQDID